MGYRPGSRHYHIVVKPPEKESEMVYKTYFEVEDFEGFAVWGDHIVSVTMDITAEHGVVVPVSEDHTLCVGGVVEISDDGVERRLTPQEQRLWVRRHNGGLLEWVREDEGSGP
jgi:hypothetical protein